MASLAPLIFSVSLALFLAGLVGSLPGRRGCREVPEPETGAVDTGDTGLGLLLVRSGRAGELTVRSVARLKVAAAVVLPFLVIPVSGLLPGRLGVVLVAGAAGLGFLAPNLMLQRAARKRLERVVSSLPDALDLLSVQIGAGRSIGSAMEGLARSGKGPLAAELGIVASEIARGAPQAEALERFRQRTGGREVSAFCATVERSRRLGSPLALELRRQASAARVDQSRAVAERAARAAPKIQLVIALVLVPAVMLLVVAALVANSDRLIGFAFG